MKKKFAKKGRAAVAFAALAARRILVPVSERAKLTAREIWRLSVPARRQMTRAVVWLTEVLVRVAGWLAAKLRLVMVCNFIRQQYNRLPLRLRNKFRYLTKIRMGLARFIRPPRGSLPWPYLVKISVSNLRKGRSRTVVTAGGVAIGVGAIVLLVSFAYGLQEVVTQRIIWPEALKVTEAVSETTTVRIDREMIDKIEELPGVKMVAVGVNLAGQVYHRGSKTDAVVVGVTNDYLKLSHTPIEVGAGFSEAADRRFTGKKEISLKSVKGVATASAHIQWGDEITGKKRLFRIRDEMYQPVFEEPKATAKIVGYSRGSLMENREGVEVWGAVYDDQGGRGRVRGPNAELYGTWLKADLPLWSKLADGFYEPYSGTEGQDFVTGYLMLDDVYFLSEIEEELEELLAGAVLAESDSASAASEAAGATGSDEERLTEGLRSGTEAARLAEVLVQEPEVADEEPEVILEVWPESSGEILLSRALLEAWSLEPEEIIGQEIELQYLVTSSLLPGVAGRAFSEKAAYRVAGILPEKTKPVAMVPLGDVESLGVNHYSSLKVLAVGEEELASVRTLIQGLGLATKSVADTLVQINRFFKIIRFVLAAFGSIALLVALFGMFNTLTVSLLERTREIGVMKSLGTTNYDVRRIFLTESVILSLLGGGGGVTIGSVLGYLIDRFVFHFSRQTGQALFLLPVGFIFMILGATLVVGVATGWYPARRAGRISALNALRYE